MKNHTPTPWASRTGSTDTLNLITGERSNERPRLLITSDAVGNGPEAIICEIAGAAGFKFGAGEIPVNDEENAALIVHCVNVHEQLVAALESLLKNPTEAVYDQAYAALAAAKEQA